MAKKVSLKFSGNISSVVGKILPKNFRGEGFLLHPADAGYCYRCDAAWFACVCVCAGHTGELYAKMAILWNGGL